MNKIDFGFASKEFEGEIQTVPYCQFMRGNSTQFGLGITTQNAELAEFEATEDWELVEYEFENGDRSTLFLNKNPRMVVLNRSQVMMSDGYTVQAYDRSRVEEGEFKAFSHAVVWFLDLQNQPLSKLPFRLKCSGYAGLTFLKNYQYYNNAESFCKKYLKIYKQLTGDPAAEKNNTFYAHAIYSPRFIRAKVASSRTGQSSFSLQTDSFDEPTAQNFSSFIIPYGTPLSQQIVELMETTASWLKSEVVDVEEEAMEQEEKTPWNNNEPVAVAPLTSIATEEFSVPDGKPQTILQSNW